MDLCRFKCRGNLMKLRYFPAFFFRGKLDESIRFRVTRSSRGILSEHLTTISDVFIQWNSLNRLIFLFSVNFKSKSWKMKRQVMSSLEGTLQDFCVFHVVPSSFFKGKNSTPATPWGQIDSHICISGHLICLCVCGICVCVYDECVCVRAWNESRIPLKKKTHNVKRFADVTLCKWGSF